jgi:hypothetical protein
VRWVRRLFARGGLAERGWLPALRGNVGFDRPRFAVIVEERERTAD